MLDGIDLPSVGILSSHTWVVEMSPLDFFSLGYLTLSSQILTYLMSGGFL
jgi:hypothetical protein